MEGSPGGSAGPGQSWRALVALGRLAGPGKLWEARGRFGKGDSELRARGLERKGLSPMPPTTLGFLSKNKIYIPALGNETNT